MPLPEPGCLRGESARGRSVSQARGSRRRLLENQRSLTIKRKVDIMKRLAGRFFKSRITQGGLLVAVVAVAAATIGWTATKSQAYKLEGSWIGKVPGTPIMWIYTCSPDPSGRSTAMGGSIPVPIGPSVVGGLFPDLEYYSTMVGQAVMTGPDTLQFTAVWYGMKNAAPFNQVVLIGVNSGQGRFIEPGKMMNTNHLAFYYPIADADHDGLPDPGQAPALCLPPTVSLETRVPIMLPCTP